VDAPRCFQESGARGPGVRRRPTLEELDSAARGGTVSIPEALQLCCQPQYLAREKAWSGRSGLQDASIDYNLIDGLIIRLVLPNSLIRLDLPLQQVPPMPTLFKSRDPMISVEEPSIMMAVRIHLSLPSRSLTPVEPEDSPFRRIGCDVEATGLLPLPNLKRGGSMRRWERCTTV
jgi:hypothetical protein